MDFCHCVIVMEWVYGWPGLLGGPDCQINGSVVSLTILLFFECLDLLSPPTNYEILLSFNLFDVNHVCRVVMME